MQGSTVSRRRFVGGSLAAGAGLLLGCSSDDSSSRSRRSPRPEQQARKVIVVGTGFGGSVTALRLARRGVDVTLIERGQRWAHGKAGTFPTMAEPDQRVAWLSETNTAAGSLLPSEPWEPYTGLLERIEGDGMDIVCAAAVGGGSLPYHGMTVQPRGDLFDRVMPDELDYEEFDDRWYPLVRKALEATPIPDDVLASDAYATSRIFQELVRSAGLPEARGVPMPVDWDVVRRELRGELPPVFSTGDVIYGVNGPGKHSLDSNYLPAAEATGHVDLLPLHRVDRLHRNRSGAWSVEVERLATDGSVQERLTLTADAVFLCAGSANTTKLLVRAKGNGDIEDLPDDVGRWWSTNGDLLTTQFIDRPTGAFQGGPASIGSLDWDNPGGPVTVLYAPVPFGAEMHGLETVGIFIPDGHGSFAYDGRRDAVDLSFPAEAHGPAMAEARRRVALIGTAGGATSALDMTAADPATFHPLGGAVIGKVCDGYGRVLGQPGLYVNDGALIPGSTACANPSLTIAALAERNIDHIIARDLGSVF